MNRVALNQGLGGVMAHLPLSFMNRLNNERSPGVDRNTLFLSSPHLCFIIVFIRDFFVFLDDPLMSLKTFTRTEQLAICFEP